MVRILNRLKALHLSKLGAGMHPDGGGLYLQVSGKGARSWVFRYMLRGKASEMGLGSLRDVPLAKARLLVASCRQQLLDGVDPLQARRENRPQAAITFQACMERYIEAHIHSWKNPKHASQWTNTFRAYVLEKLGNSPVNLITTEKVLEVLEPIWIKKTETASRLRGRLEAVLDWATARGLREGANPARWKGHLDKLLPGPTKVRRVKHHPALPFGEIAGFIQKLKSLEGPSVDALEFTILTATRTSEAIGARWVEIDLEEGVWTIPPDRIKSGREHRVPLTKPVITLLRRIRHQHGEQKYEFVFRAGKSDKPLSTMALLKVLERMGRRDITVHGFRSCFRDWTAECTAFPRDVAEMALAHTIGDKVEAAYRRGDLFNKRKQLMAAWASYCYSPRQIIKKSGEEAA